MGRVLSEGDLCDSAVLPPLRGSSNHVVQQAARMPTSNRDFF